MDTTGSCSSKRSFSELQATCQRRPHDDDFPVKKKLRTKLVDLFNRASLSLTTPLEDHMKVYLRIKPLAKNEDGSQKCLDVDNDENTIVATAPEQSHTYKSMKRGLGKSSHKFTFSRIFNANTTQGNFFNDTMLSMTKDFISGQNSLVFTYGVTSSGKTYTIQGKPQDAGILPRCLDVLFNSISGKQITSFTLKPRMFTDVVRLSPEEVVLEKKIKEKTLRLSVEDDTTVMALLGDEMESVLSDTATSNSSACADDLLPDVDNRDREEMKVDVEDQGKIRFGVWVSFAEIYNEQIFDLLEPLPHKKNARRPVLKICDDRNGNPYIKGLKEIHVESADEAYRLLTIGQRNLQTACTRLNHCSSRSHCIFNIKIVRVVDKDDPHIARVSMLSLCDLAGSERYSKTQATGDRLKEAGNINTSLMTLGRCIETLRHNQLHREQQRLVPFRDSKLTRLLQNFFNGSGRAAMIVNVSQCASMFDDTLHVFKFSAIAKQVKYIEKPQEPPKPLREKKMAQLAQRPSIAWETPDRSRQEKTVKEAQNIPLPEDEEDSLGEEDIEEEEDSSDTISEMRSYIKTLEMRNEKLVEMVEEEMANASKIESRVRQEVTSAMMKQVVNIEETYSTMLRETSDVAQELADERVKGVMAVYEQRLERIQRKIDDEDEWVSSLLFHQEQMKVEERDAKIADLENQIKELKTGSKKKTQSADDSVDIGNAMLIETLTQKLQDTTNSSKEKDSKIEELESLIAEAGEVYNKHVEEITKLQESVSQHTEKVEKQISVMNKLEGQLSETKTLSESLKQSLQSKEAELETTVEDFSRKLQSKDSTISSLEEECKELQEEIERLQDQMSQMGDESKYRHDLEASAVSQNASNTSGSSKQGSESKVKVENVVESDMSSTETPDNQDVQVTDSAETPMEENNKSPSKEEMIGQVTKLKEDISEREEEIESLRQMKEKLGEEIKALQDKNQELVTNLALVNEKDEKSVKDIKTLNETIEKLAQDIESAHEFKKQSSEQIQSLTSEKDRLLKDLESLEKEKGMLNEKVQSLEEKMKNLHPSEKEVHPSPSSISIGDMVRQIEIKTTPSVKKEFANAQNKEVLEESDDSEIVFNPKSVKSVAASAESPVASKTPSSAKGEMTDCVVSSDLGMKLKDSELANAALRNKLKREEEDFFKREQALIHGYTAEIDNLKYELAKFKTKVDGPSRTKSQRNKRKAAALDISTCSTASDSLCEGSDGIPEKRLMTIDESSSAAPTESVHLLSSEVTSLQQQLFSLSAAYRKLERQDKEGNETNSFIKDVVMGTPRGRQSVQGIFNSENATDSVLQFEMEECAIKIEEMRMKMLQQESELKTSKMTCKEEKNAKKALEIKLNELLEQKQQATSEKEEKNLQVNFEEKWKNSESAKFELESKVKELEILITQWQETVEQTIALKNEAENKLKEVSKDLATKSQKLNDLEEELRLSQKMVEELTVEKSEMQNHIEQLVKQISEEGKSSHHHEVELKKLQDKLDETRTNKDQMAEKVKHLEEEIDSVRNELGRQQEECQATETKLEAALEEKNAIDQDLKNQKEEMKSSAAKLDSLQQNYNDIKEKMEKITSVKGDLETKVEALSEVISAKEEKMKGLEQDHKTELKALKQQYCNEGETKSETISTLQEQIEGLRTKLKTTTSQLEKVESHCQEESAEFSQKLLMLEREKKVIERQATEAKEREQEWQMKCQGLDRMKQLEAQLHEQLKTAAITVRKHSEKTSELREELASKNKELHQLREEENSILTARKTEVKDLEERNSQLEETLSSEKELKLQAEKRVQECIKEIDVLKKGLTDSEDMNDQQEKFINRQDEELSTLKNELETLAAENEKLDRVVTRKELELANLNKQVTKLEGEVKNFHQVEKKAWEVEQRAKVSYDQLQKFGSEKGALEEKLQKLESEKVTSEEKIESKEKQIKKQTKEIEELEERTKDLQKQKNDLEKEIEKVNKLRVEELEHRKQIETELRQFKKEVDKKAQEKSKTLEGHEMLEKEHQDLKTEISGLKQDLDSKVKSLHEIEQNLKDVRESKKNLEKDLHRQERVNQRNREEMENWKQERDACVSKLEQLINKRQQENKQLTQEVEQLKKDNSDLAKNVSNINSMKDSVIADLRKSNNTLSIQLAQVQGMSPPPRMATPDSGFPNRMHFIEDLDTTGHLEIDATPPVAAKKCRKRNQSQSSSVSSSVDPDTMTTPIRKSLRTIEEQNESSSGTPKSPRRSTSPAKSLKAATGRVAELASDVLASISPITRSAKRQQEKGSKKKKKSSIQAPFDLASFVATDDQQNENTHPFSTRRSSRLRTKPKNSAV